MKATTVTDNLEEIIFKYVVIISEISNFGGMSKNNTASEAAQACSIKQFKHTGPLYINW